MSVLAEWPCDTWRTVGFRLRCARDCEWPRVVVCTCPVRVRQACLWAEPRPPSGSAAEETRGSEQHPRSLGVDVERARPWAEAAARPRPARDSQSPLSPHKGQPAFCPLLSASPGKPSWPCVRLLHAPTVRLSYPFSICPGAQRRGGGVGGRPRTQEVPCGGLWARPELAATPGGKDIPRSPKSFHSSLLPPPPLTLSFKGEGRWGWGWGTEACRVSSLLPGTPGRAERARALDSQAPSPGQPPH